MKIKSDSKTGSVVVVLTAREATRVASTLVRCAIQSGGAVEADRQEPMEEKVEKREG